MSKILITGGSGLVGRRITELLLAQGHEVAWLSRSSGEEDGIRRYRWSLREGFIDPKAFIGVEHIIHLAGANLIGKRWTTAYKHQLFESRVRTAELLYRHVLARNIRLKSYTGASASGYYGAVINDKVYSESDRPAADFLAQLCVAWEKAHSAFRSVASQTTIVRSAVVLAREDGALRKMLPFFRAGLGAAVASGQQYFPWIHIDDIARLYATPCLDDSMRGTFNGVAPEIVTNRQFSVALAAACNRKLRLPNVPAFILRLVLGEASSTLITGPAMSSGKLQDQGFRFRFARLNEALRHLAAERAT